MTSNERPDVPKKDYYCTVENDFNLYIIPRTNSKLNVHDAMSVLRSAATRIPTAFSVPRLNLLKSTISISR